MRCCCSRRRGRWAGSDCALCWASASRRECGIERGMPELRVSLCHAVGAKQALESDLGCGAEARAQAAVRAEMAKVREPALDRKSTRLNSSHANISYAVFCLKKKNT